MKRLLLLTCLILSAPSWAQVSESDPLFARAMALDARLFNESFNECKPGVLETLIDTRLEFYHDVGGIQDRDAFLAAMAKNICGPVEKKPSRKLVGGSSKVFPLKKDGKLYGLIHHGDHEFWLREAGKPEYPAGRARFTSVWVETAGEWKLRTVLSYDHGPAR
ncbi:MAG: nuclear transport factor 2 family protein [Burkholderiales bacterium]|nr:nuclear transport factor 2 family protein [Burkholderiales bacterium]